MICLLAGEVDRFGTESGGFQEAAQEKRNSMGVPYQEASLHLPVQPSRPEEPPSRGKRNPRPRRRSAGNTAAGKEILWLFS